MEKMPIEKKKCITPEFRVSFPSVFKAKAFQEQEAKFSLVMLFDKKTDISSLKKIIFNAAVEKWGPKEKWPKKLRMPFRDGDEKEDMMGYAGTTFCSASSKSQPGLVDQRRQAIISEDVFYPGCYARAEVIAYGYDVAGNRGVGLSLQNVQKLRDGEPFSGRKKAEDVFDAVDDGSDDEENYGGSDTEADDGEDDWARA